MQLTSAKCGPERPPKRPLTLSNIRPGEARPMPLTSAKSANSVQHPARRGRRAPLTLFTSGPERPLSPGPGGRQCPLNPARVGY